MKKTKKQTNKPRTSKKPRTGKKPKAGKKPRTSKKPRTGKRTSFKRTYVSKTLPRSISIITSPKKSLNRNF